MVGALTLAGAVSPGFQLLAAPVLFLAGTALGLFHGGVLGLVGRPADQQLGAACRCELLALILVLPALFLAWLVTAGISLTAAVVTEFRVGWTILAALAWMAGLALCAWAAREGWAAARRAFLRWPHHRVGGALLAGALILSSAILLSRPPRIPGTDLLLSPVAGLLVAVGATLWIGLPLVVLSLRLVDGFLSSSDPREDDLLASPTPGEKVGP